MSQELLKLLNAKMQRGKRRKVFGKTSASLLLCAFALKIFMLSIRDQCKNVAKTKVVLMNIALLVMAVIIYLPDGKWIIGT